MSNSDEIKTIGSDSDTVIDIAPGDEAGSDKSEGVSCTCSCPEIKIRKKCKLFTGIFIYHLGQARLFGLLMWGIYAKKNYVEPNSPSEGKGDDGSIAFFMFGVFSFIFLIFYINMMINYMNENSKHPEYHDTQIMIAASFPTVHILIFVCLVCWCIGVCLVYGFMWLFKDCCRRPEAVPE